MSIKRPLILTGDNINSGAVGIHNEAFDLYNKLSLSPFRIQSEDLRNKAKRLVHAEDIEIEDIKLAANITKEILELEPLEQEPLGVLRKKELQRLLLTDKGPQSVRDLLEEFKRSGAWPEVAGAVLSRTYYQQQIEKWEAKRAEIDQYLQIKASYEKALQKNYLALEKHWNYIQAISVYGGVNSPTTFDEFYNHLRVTFGRSSTLHSETTREEQALYNECKDIFSHIPRENFRENLKKWWDELNNKPEREDEYRKTHEKIQKQFVSNAVQKFKEVEEKYAETPSVANEKILQHHAAKLIAVMTLADDRKSKTGLHNGIPEAWLDSENKEDLLRRAKEAVHLTNHLKLSEKDCSELEIHFKEIVEKNPDWHRQKKQGELFYQHYLKIYQTAVDKHKKTGYSSSLEEVRKAGLNLEYVCKLLEKPYRAEISYYQDKVNAANNYNAAMDKSYRDLHQELVDKVLDQYLEAASYRSKIKARLRFQELRKLYNQNYGETFGSYANNKLTAKVKEELEKPLTVNIFYETPIVNPVNQRVLYARVEKIHEVTATREQLFEINKEWTNGIAHLPEHMSSYRNVMGDGYAERLERELVLNHYFKPIFDLYEQKSKEKGRTKKNSKNKQWWDDYEACVKQLLYRMDFCRNRYPDWYVIINQESFEKIRKDFPAWREENHFGLEKEDLREEKKIQRQLKDNFALLSVQVTQFQKDKTHLVALGAEDVQVMAVSLTRAFVALERENVGIELDDTQKLKIENRQSELKKEAKTLIDTMLDKIAHMGEEVDPFSDIFVKMNKYLQYTERDGSTQCAFPLPERISKKLNRDDLTKEGNADGVFSHLRNKVQDDFDLTLPTNILESFIEFTLRLGDSDQQAKLAVYFQLPNQIIPLVQVETKEGAFFAPVIDGINWDTDIPKEGGQANKELVSAMQPLSAIFITMNLLAQKAEAFLSASREGVKIEDISKLLELETAIAQIKVLQEKALNILNENINGRTNIFSYVSKNRNLAMELKENLTSAIPKLVKQAENKWKKSADKLAAELRGTLFRRDDQQL
jgi:hypothetical protein